MDTNITIADLYDAIVDAEGMDMSAFESEMYAWGLITNQGSKS